MKSVQSQVIVSITGAYAQHVNNLTITAADDRLYIRVYAYNILYYYTYWVIIITVGTYIDRGCNVCVRNGNIQSPFVGRTIIGIPTEIDYNV